MPEVLSNLDSMESGREKFESKLELRKQYDAQIAALKETGVLRELQNDSLGIIGIDNKEYPVPSYEKIVQSIIPEEVEFLNKKAESGFDRLLLVPFAMPFKNMLDIYGEELVKHYSNDKLQSSIDKNVKVKLNTDQPIYLEENLGGANIEDNFVYKVDGHSQTKQEIISGHGGWQVGLIVNSENALPINYDNNDKRIAGDYEEPIYPEAELTNAILRLKQENTLTDEITADGSACVMYGAHNERTNGVPYFGFSRSRGRVEIGTFKEDLVFEAGSGDGTRTFVGL